MSGLPESGPIPPTPTRSGAPLRAMRCARHGEREAVARCPSCGGSFCRECVSEHEGRLLCSQCLARVVVPVKAAAPKRDWTGFRVGFGRVSFFLLLWGLFYLFGHLLLRIPTEVHEGTIWRDPFGS